MTEWAAKVLEGAQRYGEDPDERYGIIPAKDGALLEYADALAAIAKLAAGDDDLALLVLDDIELFRAIKKSGAKKRIDIARAVIQHLEPRETILFARIAALTAQVAEAEREAESRSAMFATACEERDAAEAEAAALRAKGGGNDLA